MRNLRNENGLPLALEGYKWPGLRPNLDPAASVLAI